MLSGDVEEITTDDLLAFAGIAPPRLRVVPIETHLAEKLHAYTMPRDRPNTRVKDLPDLALLGTIRPHESGRRLTERSARAASTPSRRASPHRPALDVTIPRWLCSAVFEVRFYATDAGRSQPTDFLDALPARDRAQIVADVMALRDHGLQAPISMKPIKGPSNRGLFEIRTGGFRTLFCQKGGVVWILHVCKKQDQDAGIDAARGRMKKL